MAPPRLDNTTARHLFLDRHALIDAPSGPGKGVDLADVIQRLGFVQLDSVNTVARAHDMILFARRQSYRPPALKRLYEVDRALFEHWTHDAAVIPMSSYPHWRFRFQRDAEMLKQRWASSRRDEFTALCGPVLSFIEDNGPVCSADLAKDAPKRSGGWWDWHPSKTALEYLWRSGALAVVGRVGFQKRYDLTERVISSALLGANHDVEASVDWLCNAALDRLGFATSGEIAAFWDSVTPAEAAAWCARNCERGAIEPAIVECATGSDRKVFTRPETLDSLRDLPDVSGRMRVLSPFDPALRDRKRTERLFGFHYRIEIFVPAEKRKYGYYVFPLMEGLNLVGRIDMKADRDAGVLRVTALWPETGVKWGKARRHRLDAELARVARFAGLDSVDFASDWLRDPAPAYSARP